MKIDISQPPPRKIFKHRGKYLWISLFILSLALCGVFLIFYGLYSDVPYSQTLETVALNLLVFPAVLFTFFGPKLRAYKRLDPREKEQLIVLSLKHPEIKHYLKQVSEQSREPVHGEYEACRDWAENAKMSTACDRGRSSPASLQPKDGKHDR
jgi:hypothetical protein